MTGEVYKKENPLKLLLPFPCSASILTLCICPPKSFGVAQIKLPPEILQKSQKTNKKKLLFCGVYGGGCDSTAPFVFFQSFPTIANIRVMLYDSIYHGYQNVLFSSPGTHKDTSCCFISSQGVHMARRQGRPDGHNPPVLPAEWALQ